MSSLIDYPVPTHNMTEHVQRQRQAIFFNMAALSRYYHIRNSKRITQSTLTLSRECRNTEIKTFDGCQTRSDETTQRARLERLPESVHMN